MPYGYLAICRLAHLIRTVLLNVGQVSPGLSAPNKSAPGLPLAASAGQVARRVRSDYSGFPCRGRNRARGR